MGNVHRVSEAAGMTGFSLSVFRFFFEASARQQKDPPSGYTGCGKSAFVVIPSEARDPLFRKAQQKSRFLGQTPPFGMTSRHFFRGLFCLSELDFSERGAAVDRLEAPPTKSTPPKPQPAPAPPHLAIA